MRFLLDTHIFIELAQEGLDGISRRARAIVENDENELLLSAVSITEIAVKASIDKLAIGQADLLQAVQDLRLSLISFEPRHALRLFQMPLHHRDPFDRMLIATALCEGLPIMSGDGEFRRYRGLRVVS